MSWKSFMLAACDEALYNWQTALPDIDIATFKEHYLDPVRGCSSVIQCPEKNQCELSCRCDGLHIRDLSTGTTACCTKKVFGPKIPVNNSCLARYSLSFSRFHSELCKKLGLLFSNVTQDNFFWELGLFKCGTAKFLPVYISYCQTKTILESKLQNILLNPKAQFVLIVFDYSMISRKTADNLTKRNCTCISIAELFKMNEDSTMQLVNDPAHIFNTYKDNETYVELRNFPCDFGTKWQDIYLNYYDDQNISVWKRKESSLLCSYNMLNMIDRRQNKPSKAFVLLNEVLRKGISTLPVPAKGMPYYSELITRKKEISIALKNFFSGMNDGDPVRYDKDRGCYSFRFNIKPPVAI